MSFSEEDNPKEKESIVLRFFNYLENHAELAFICKGVALYGFIYLLKDIIFYFLIPIVIFFPVFVFLFAWVLSIRNRESVFSVLGRHLSLMPFAYTEGGWKEEKVAWVTYLIILVNIFVHLHIHEQSTALTKRFILDNFIFLPHIPSLWNVPIGAVTNIFMHGSYSHLWGNMLFLWAFGTVVERRVGSVKFFWLYMATGFISSIVDVGVVYMASGKVQHALGASGAISGVMGLYAVRCYFKNLIIPIPVLGLLSIVIPLNLKIKVNAIFVVGFFFFLDVVAGLREVRGVATDNTANWAHIGGMVSGVLLAMKLGLTRKAVEEKHLEIGINASTSPIGLEEGERALRIALGEDTKNPDALLALARIKTRFRKDEEGRDLYTKAIEYMFESRPDEAAEAYKEYYWKYLLGVEPNLQYKIAGRIYDKGDLDFAATTFEMVSNLPQAPINLRENALFRTASIFEMVGFYQAAGDNYERFLKEFPTSPLCTNVRISLKKIRVKVKEGKD
ncbi:MAG: rhomboid family intramembrane serine protease [Deltaproteobacteria bacterium]|nr:rhomboid family intramembrane serine protease [Deltaproteobacteria bacterium]